MEQWELIYSGNFTTVLLDRDGTINVHLVGDYVKKWEDFEFIPDVINEFPKLAKRFRNIFIVTNQRGVGRGLYTETDLEIIHQRMILEIEKVGGRIDGIYYSTAVSDNDHSRKPNIGMFEKIISEHPDVTPETTIMIGDSDVDMLFAKNCGIHAVRVNSLKKKDNIYYWEYNKHSNKIIDE